MSRPNIDPMDNDIDSYIIIIDQCFETLWDKVNDHMKNGYVPQGGVSRSNTLFMQAMVINV